MFTLMPLSHVPTTEQAVTTAVAIARAQGLRVDDPRVVKAGGNVWVHLLPSPIVAQIPKDVVAFRGPSAVTHLARDLEVCGWLAERELPVGAPADLLPPGPYEQDGLCVGFYKLYRRSLERDPKSAGRALRRLHEALADYPGSLSELEAPLREPNRILGILQGTPPSSLPQIKPEQLRLLRLRLGICERLVSGWATRPVHGDAHIENVLWAQDGPLWTDWENVCRAPLAWDFACLAASTAVYGVAEDKFTALLEGYGARLDLRELGPLIQLRVIEVTLRSATRAAWDRAAGQRLKAGLHWLRYHHL